MNWIAGLILTVLIVNALVHWTADALNLRRLSAELPEAFRGWYDPRQYQQSQAYLRETTRFGWVAGGVDLLVALGFWFGGGFGLLDHWVRALNFSPIPSGLIYIGLLAFAKSLLGLPFDLYATFVIEENYGFNKTTGRLYLLDKLKGLLLGLVLGAPLLAAVLAFFVHAAEHAWWAGWLISVIFFLIVQYIAPTWLMPLFNRFDPLPEGELRAAITAYARSVGFALDGIFVMDGSRRSTRSNAFFTGIGRHRRIVLFDTLIEKHTVEELVAVLAHEMGHYKLGHVIKMLALGVVQLGVMFYILSFFITYPPLFKAFFVEEVSVHAGLVFFAMLYAPIGMVSQLGLHYISRAHEYAADRFAKTTCPYGRSLGNALKRLSVDNLSNLTPHPFYVFLNYSHPPVLDRIHAIEAGA